MRNALAAAAALGLVLGAGCYSGLASGGLDGDSAADGGPGGSADDGETTGGNDSGGPEIGECAPGRVGLRRLNKREFGNTLRDLLGVDPSVVDPLPVDPSKGGFDTNASVLGITPELLDLYMGVTEDAVTQALSDQPQMLIDCTPDTNAFSDACVQDTLTTFAERAYRRPLTAQELTDLEAFYADSASGGASFEDAASTVFQGLLVSPQALYRNYVPPAGDKPVALDQYALASRLSYFLWASTPDRALLDAAGAGDLYDEAALVAQVERLLAHDKADAFIQSFATQWLGISGLASKEFNPELFPEADEELLAAMQSETVELVRHVLTSDLPASELLTADYTFVDQRLADLYGIAGVSGTALEQVPVPAGERQGILTHASILAATSHPDRTSIPHRGMWVLENVMCLPPPPPPPDSVDSSEFDDDTEPKTQREKLEVHRQKPECNGCHKVMDELGFGLENYGPIGAWRDLDNGLPVDASGVLPDGREFEGGPQLAALLAVDDTMARCLASNVLSYGIGRLLTNDDDCTIDELEAEGLSAAQVIARIVLSDPFRFEGAEGEEDGA